MEIRVSLHLYWKPHYELGEENESASVTAAAICGLADGVKARMDLAAAAALLLEAHGWNLEVVLGDLTATHPEVRTKKAARDWLKQVGIDPKAVRIERQETGEEAVDVEAN